MHLPLRALAAFSHIANMGLIISVGFDSCNFSEGSTEELYVDRKLLSWKLGAFLLYFCPKISLATSEVLLY